jgi:hypothetical protein
VSLNLYVAQIIGIAAVLLVLLRHQSWLLQAQVIVWSIATAALASRFGLIEQLNFYSNDQGYYHEVVLVFPENLFLIDIDWWMTASRFPYTLPAVVLYGVGIEPALALKTISLVCLLLTTKDVLASIHPLSRRTTVFSLLVTACGAIGLLFSILALRETMLMLFTTRFVRSTSPTTRLTVALLLFVLRPHLAASLMLGALIVWIYRYLRTQKPETVLTMTTAIIGGSVIGWWLFDYGVVFTSGIKGSFSHSWGISPITRIASNYVGLQFLTSYRETVSFSLLSLLMLRLVLIETILIPTLFTLLILTRPNSLNQQRMLIATSFAIYVGLATNTNFNSFRQNIPFMPVMGLAILAMAEQGLRNRKFEVTHS